MLVSGQCADALLSLRIHNIHSKLQFVAVLTAGSWADKYQMKISGFQRKRNGNWYSLLILSQDTVSKKTRVAADLRNNVIALLAVFPMCTIPGSKTMSNDSSKITLCLFCEVTDE